MSRSNDKRDSSFRSQQNMGADYSTTTQATYWKQMGLQDQGSLSYCWLKQLVFEQLDINNAFLHGDLDEEVHMTVPQGYSTSLPPNTVCKLKKSMYDLKQANRQWFTKLTTFLLSLRFQQSYADTSLFTLHTQNNFLTLLVYVDDILLAGNNQSLINSIKQQLHETFSIKDLGPLHYYLGIKILRNSNGNNHFCPKVNYALAIATKVVRDSIARSISLQDLGRQTHLPHHHKTKHLLCCPTSKPILTLCKDNSHESFTKGSEIYQVVNYKPIVTVIGLLVLLLEDLSLVLLSS
ncbi:retrovirus-related pol polyprotein from transposon TNT 1-94 [Tanacetum coccineum]